MTQNFFEHSTLKKLLQQPYSPDILPWDFYLFGRIKIRSICQEILDEIILFESVSAMPNAIFPAELHCVFRNWIGHVESMIGAVGGEIGY
jgi:hypothetical protein